MINIGDINVGNEIILNSFQSQVYNEVLTKLENFGISGYDIDHESYIVQKTLAKHVAETISPDEENLGEIARMSQIVFQTLTNPDLYDSDIVSEGLLQWIEIGNPYSFFSKKNVITDLSGNANDMRFPKGRVTPKGFRRNGTINKKEIPSLFFNGKGSRLNATTVIDDVLEPDARGDVSGLKEGSIEMWVKLKKQGMGAKNQYHTLFHFHCPGTNFSLLAYVGRNGEIRINKITYNEKDDKKQLIKVSQTDSGVVPFNDWVHLVINFTGNGPICYSNTDGYKFPNTKYAEMYNGTVSGFLNDFGAAELSDGTELNLAPENLWIGAKRRKDNKFEFTLKGEVSSFRIYDRILDDGEIKQNFDSSKGQYTGE